MKAPSPPDPMTTANAQGGMNRDTAISQQLLNFTNQYTPDGSLVYNQTGTTGFTDSQGNWIEIPQFEATVSLSPEQQRIKDQTNEAQFNLSKIANNQSAFLNDYLGKPIDTSGAVDMRTSIGGSFNPNFNGNIAGLQTSYAGADDFSADRQRYEDALMARMDPDLQANQDRTRNQLINAGLRPGTAAWNSEFDRLSRAENDARMSAILGAGDEQSRMVGMARDAASFNNATRMGQAQFAQQAQAMGNQASLQDASFTNNARANQLQEIYAQRNQPLNEISALLSGSQVGSPQFNSTPQTGVAGVDYTGLVNQKYQAELANHQSMMGGLFGLLSAPFAFSDRRLKTDIRRVGETDSGVPIYTYRFKGDPVTHMGVMAQELEDKQPDAVHEHSSGFLMVDYARVH